VPAGSGRIAGTRTERRFGRITLSVRSRSRFAHALDTFYRLRNDGIFATVKNRIVQYASGRW
jgi:hypothetical protein